jgi:c-di-GMP-binding flagellar brake protein YcgR
MSWPIERKHQRVQVALQGELHCASESFPRRAQTTDLSLGGCYFEMPYTLQPKTRVQAVLWIDGTKIQAWAEVVTNHPQVGNGIRFVEMDEEDREKLKNFIEAMLKGAGFAAHAAQA